VLRGDGNNQARARFNILGPLGAGGFGAVYEAVDARSGQHVALKELADTSADSIARFKQEFRALTECHHENLVSVRELIEQEGRWLIVMELVPGVDFLRYVRRVDNDNADLAHCDEERLRNALVGILRGLAALHAFGVVHRDLKPANVRVRPDGRVVLLDFGLATSVDPKQQSTHAMGVGTAVYMAPEQAGGRSISAAADLYALGVCLFEALTGEAPFEGAHAIKILLEKQTKPARDASELVAGVPPDLDAFCSRLLAIDPETRPSAEQALAILTHGSIALSPAPSQADRELALSLAPPRGASGEEFFAGREAELTHLERALARTDEGEFRVVLVEGESGVGKSELVSEFIRRLRARDTPLWVLRGRCYENEQVSYKAFDGCIDELSKLLRRMSMNECRALLPERAALLGQLFPVLRNIKAIASATREGSSADPSARRLEAFAALAQLLAKASEERALVLVLDDLQWADGESFRLLAALAEQNPRPPIFLIGTVRPRNELEAEIEEQLEGLRKQRHVDVVPLAGLPRVQAKVLTKKLFGKHVPDAWLELIADESQGHPLFIGELVQYTHSHDFASRGRLTLEAALRARIERLDRRARELLEIVALAARPHPSNVFAGALATSVEEPARTLLAAKLLRQRRGDELGCYHDRIRHAAVDLIVSTRLPALHHQLASALEQQPAVDASESAHHWDLAGHPERASAAYELAAGRAFEALALRRAAQLYARAIALTGDRFDERRLRLSEKRADALAASGMYREAADLYRHAGDFAAGRAKLALRSRAANALLLSGQIVAGVDAARALFADVGVSMPKGALTALLRYALEAFRILLQGGQDGRRLKGASTGEQNDALKVMRELRRPIMILNPLASLLLGVQYVRRAMQSGSANHVGYAMMTRAWAFAVRGRDARILPLLETGRKLMCEENPDPAELATALVVSGSTRMASMDWTTASVELQQAHELARQHCAYDPMTLTTIRYHLGMAWYMLGEHARIAREVPGWLAEARERNDVLAVALLTGMGHGSVRHLMDDDPAKALAELEASFVAKPDEPYGIPHFGQFVGTHVALLYGGGTAARRFLEEHRALHGRSFLLRAALGREGLTIASVFGLLSALVVASAKERPELVRAIRRDARVLVRHRSHYIQTVGRMGLAQAEALSGARDKALAHAEAAVVCSKNLLGYARGAKYLLASLQGDAQSAETRRTLLEELRVEGWKNPRRAIAIIAPVALLLDDERAPERQQRTTLLLGRYEITGTLGSGGFGAVVAAHDTRTGQKVAIKELVRSGGTSIERFKREFRALSEVHHENIVQLASLFEHDGRWYIAMELLDGVDLVSYVRASGSCDVTRLRSTFLGLARALEALHEVGLVHRDIKPDNVIVTREGRPVLIDFGLVARMGQKAEGKPAGSFEFASPEQLAGAPPSAESDVYSLGACLFQALSGEVPFAANELATGAGRRAQRPLAVAAHLESLRELCLRMLATRGEERPSLQEIISECAPASALGSPAQRLALRRPTLDDQGPEWVFAGRELELARLSANFREEQHAGPTLVLIEGESGLGKSALASQFAALCLRETPLLRVLRGRCYENEQVAFKAFDRAIDQLAGVLRALPEPQCEAILPKRSALLAQLFPVLGGVPVIERASKKGLPADPAARKQAGRECFAALLAALCAERRLLLVIDDLQWADGESFDLLRALLARGEDLAPMFVLATVRPDREIEPSVLREIDTLIKLPRVQRVTLGLLDERAGVQLARQLLGSERDAESLSAIVHESKGHPLFLRELIEHDRRGLNASGKTLTLDDALGARIESLSPEARGLLELAAVLGKPYGIQVFERALGPDRLSRDAMVSLLGQGLLQRRGDKLACYHDRIRHVTLARISGDRRARIARSLALALSRELRADAADKARLWDEAGDTAEAIAAYELSGDQALRGLAFVHAEQDYGRALSLFGDAARDERFKRLAVARGHALVGAGRSAEAARMFQEAAELAEGEEKVRLRIWTAQHLILSAQVEPGIGAATKLLSELGLSLPSSDKAAVTRIAYERARVKLRGIRLGQRRADANERLRLDALHGLAAPVRDCIYLPGSALMAQYLRRALAAGDPVHSARALAYESLWRSVNSIEHDSSALFEQSRSLADATHEPALIAEIALVRGLACVSQRQMARAPAHLWAAHDLVQSQCPGQPWLLNASRTYLGMAWFHSGNFQEMQHHMDGWIQEARARDDRQAVAALCGFGAASFRHVVAGAPERGIEELALAMAAWPKQPFTTHHAGALLTGGMMLATFEDGVRLREMLEAGRVEHDRAFLLRTPTLQLALRWLRAAALLRSIERPGAPGSKEVLARVRAESSVLKRAKGPFARSTYLSLSSWILFLSGDREGTLRMLKLAEQAGADAEPFNTVAVRYMLGVLEGGESGRQRCQTVKAQLEAFGFRDFRLGLAMRTLGRLSLLDP
jgi:serine/threonine protein kinase/predicted ATPase/tetratricopeptide (TPR) repeat protein